MKRLISALCILPPLVAHRSLWILLFTSCSLSPLSPSLALVEFYQMLSAKGFPCWGWLGVTCGGALPLAFYVGGIANQGAVAAMVLLSFMVGLFTRQELVISVQSIAFTLLGMFYVGWLLSYVLLLRLLIHGPDYVFYHLWRRLAWRCGRPIWLVRLFGRHRLAPSISPRKTIEGAVGGFLGSLCGAILGGLWFLGHFTLTQCLAAGCMLAVLGQLGDLSESLLKRSCRGQRLRGTHSGTWWHFRQGRWYSIWRTSIVLLCPLCDRDKSFHRRRMQRRDGRQQDERAGEEIVGAML